MDDPVATAFGFASLACFIAFGTGSLAAFLFIVSKLRSPSVQLRALGITLIEELAEESSRQGLVRTTTTLCRCRRVADDRPLLVVTVLHEMGPTFSLGCIELEGESLGAAREGARWVLDGAA